MTDDPTDDEIAPVEEKPGDDFTEEDIVFMGRRMLKGGKLGNQFIPLKQLNKLVAFDVAAETIEAAASVFAVTKGDRTYKCGGLYTMECKLDGDGRLTTYRPSTVKFVNDPCIALAPAWRERDQSAWNHLKQAQLEARVGDKSDLQKALDTVAWHYKRVGYGDRRAFELMVLNRLAK